MKKILGLAALTMAFSTVAFAKGKGKEWAACAKSHPEWKTASKADKAKAKSDFLASGVCPPAADAAPAASDKTATPPPAATEAPAATPSK